MVYAKNFYLALLFYLPVASSLFIANDAFCVQPAVASAHPLATEAGIDILKKGGNAFDAAVAVTAALGVVEPYSSGFGGGGFWLLHVKNKNINVMIDGRERAPLAATRDMYLDGKGNVKAGASINGPLAAGIPGVPAALEYIANKYGSLSLKESLGKAIEYARDGFVVDEHYQKMAKIRLEALQASKDAARIFLINNAVPGVGSLIKQTDLANTIEIISDKGAKGFYEGEVARKLVQSVSNHGGIWSMDDLAQYSVVEREPEMAIYKGMKIVTASPPSSGGIALIEILNQLSFYDLENMQKTKRIHIIAEAMRRAYRDRAEYLGDPDYVDIPKDELLSNVYANKLKKSINVNKATPSSELKPVSQPTGNGNDTTHFSIIDGEGNSVSATLSINYPFGSGFVAEGTGVLLNDEMDDFSVKPGEPNVYGLVGAEANAIEPGKRMLSSMSPSFVETADRMAIVGTPGGSRIITMVLLAMLDFYKGGDAKHMVETGRFHHQYLPDKIYFEPNLFSKEEQLELMDYGHELNELDDTYGNMHVIIVNKKSQVTEAASDPRGVGRAVVIH